MIKKNFQTQHVPNSFSENELSRQTFHWNWEIAQLLSI